MSGSNQEKVDLQQCSPRRYLDETVVEIVMEGMSLLAKERPSDVSSAVEWLGQFLIKNKNYKTGAANTKNA
jgi:protein dpy-30